MPSGGSSSSAVAFRFEQHRTFQKALAAEIRGPFIYERRTYFDEHDRRLRDLEKASVVKTGAALPPASIPTPGFDVWTRLGQLQLPF